MSKFSEETAAILKDASWQLRLSIAKQMGAPVTTKADADAFLAESDPAEIRAAIEARRGNLDDRSEPQVMDDMDAIASLGLPVAGQAVDMGYARDPGEEDAGGDEPAGPNGDLPRTTIQPGATHPSNKYGDRTEDARPNEHGFVQYEVSDKDLVELVKKFKEGLQPEDWWPRVICMKMGPPGKVTHALFGWAAGGMQRIDFMPFQRSGPLHPKMFANITKPKQSRQYGTWFMRLWPEPPKHMANMATGRVMRPHVRGNCGGHMEWHDKISKQQIPTCIYSDCPHHPLPRGTFHSIWQGQQFIATLRNDSTIRAFIRLYDSRAPVGMFATLVIDQRQRKLMESMGMGGHENPDMVY